MRNPTGDLSYSLIAWQRSNICGGGHIGAVAVLFISDPALEVVELGVGGVARLFAELQRSSPHEVIFVVPRRNGHVTLRVC